MTETQFVALVQRAGGFESPERAADAAEVILSRLSRSISRGEAADLAEPLPERFAHALLDIEQRRTEPEPLPDFLEAVTEQADLSGDARATIRGVFAAVSEYAGAEEVENAAAQLPPEYGAIIEPGEVPLTQTFVDTVQNVTDLGGEAAEATEATLTVLGQRLTAGEAEDIATYLHGDAESWLIDRATSDAADLSTEEFVGRVARETDVTDQRAREYVENVTHALSKEVPDREIDRAIAQLPDEYGALFGFD